MTPFYQPRNVDLVPGLTLPPQFGSASGDAHRPLNADAPPDGVRRP